MPRVIEVGLSARRVSEEELAALLEEFEERIRSHLRRRLRRRIDEFDIVVLGHYHDGVLDLTVDVRVVGKSIGPLSYEEVIAEAIEEAGQWLESRLREPRGVEGVGEEGVERDTRHGDADSGDGSS